MPGLNIRYTEAELEQLRHRAKVTGTPVTKLVHDDSLTATELAAHRLRVDAAADRVIARSRQALEILADE